ncbi:MAG: (2Fe-2S)-binding protein [Planctomycetes bacterium]|nr:(2Fe-2S)-binding protein [Planctomycetota bacterium]
MAEAPGPRLRPESARGPRVRLTCDGVPVEAHPGETVAMALWAADRRTLRRSTRLGAPRGVFCNMGICFECLVRIDGHATRACLAEVRDGMRVETIGPAPEAGA